MLKRVKLTDAALRKLMPAPSGRRYDVMDTDIGQMGVRVTDKGRISFVFVARFPGRGRQNQTRRKIGNYPAMPLKRAREIAREWIAMLEEGKDPKVERAIAEKNAKEEDRQRRENSFRSVAEDFIARKLPHERKGVEVERDIRREFLPLWGESPIDGITSGEIRHVIEKKAVSAPAQARNFLGILKGVFAWAVHDERLSASPCATLKTAQVVGPRKSTERILSRDELFALWRGSFRLGYPHGNVYRVLLLTALRLNEAADASWPEIDLNAYSWEIPAARMKGRPDMARSHVVPIFDQLRAELEMLPRFIGRAAGSFLFSTTDGVKPVWMSDKVKKRLDRRMQRTLKALARIRGDDAVGVELPRWTNHDIRRTVRSNLARLKVADDVCEAVLAHAQPGIRGVYNQYKYLDEKREALATWAAELAQIVDAPNTQRPAGNVFRLRIA